MNENPVESAVFSESQPKPAKRRPLLLIVLPILLIIAVVLLLLWMKQRPVPLRAMVPQTAVGYAVMNGEWWIENSKSIRELPDVKRAMDDFERATAVSMEKEVLPCVGDVAIVVTGVKAQEPEFAFCMQPCDLPRAVKTYQKLMKKAESDKWEKVTYQGVELVALPDNGRDRILAGFDRGWVLMGAGSSVKQLIDSGAGRKPSVAEGGRLRNALASAGRGTVVRAVFDNKAVADMPGMSRTLPGQMPGKMDAVVGFSVIEASDGFRVEWKQKVDGAKLLERGKRIYSAGSESWTIADQMPDSTVAWLAFRNFGVLFKEVLESFKEASSDQEYARGIAEIERLLYKDYAWFGAALDNIKQMSIGVTLRDNKEFGAVLVADTGAEDIAKNLCEGLVAEIRRNPEPPVVQNGNRWMIPIAQDPAPEFPMEPAMERQGRFVTLTTDSSWLDSARGKPGVPLPSAAGDSPVVFTADLMFTDTIINAMEKAGGVEKDVIQLLRDFKLSKAKAVAWTTLDGDDIWFARFEISGWPWKDARDSVVKYIKDHPNEVSL